MANFVDISESKLANGIFYHHLISSNLTLNNTFARTLMRVASAMPNSSPSYAGPSWLMHK